MREVIIRVRDDIDGSDADETVAFSVRGTNYEIDLSAANAELFDKSMKQFIEVAREVVPEVVEKPVPRRGSGYAPAPRVSPVVKAQRKAIRVWANNSGFTVDERGVIATAVVEAYRLAHPNEYIHPDTVPARKNLGDVVSVKAQDLRDEEGLISAASLLQRHSEASSTPNGACDPKGNPLSKARRTEIRVWAQEQGLDQSMVGQIKQETLDAYFAAHPEKE